MKVPSTVAECVNTHIEPFPRIQAEGVAAKYVNMGETVNVTLGGGERRRFRSHADENRLQQVETAFYAVGI